MVRLANHDERAVLMSAAAGEPVEIHAGSEAAYEDVERMVAGAQGSVDGGRDMPTRHVENLQAAVDLRGENAHQKRGVVCGWIGKDAGNGGLAVKRWKRWLRGRAVRLGCSDRGVGVDDAPSEKCIWPGRLMARFAEDTLHVSGRQVSVYLQHLCDDACDERRRKGGPSADAKG